MFYGVQKTAPHGSIAFLAMNVLRRKGDAQRTDAGFKKSGKNNREQSGDILALVIK